MVLKLKSKKGNFTFQLIMDWKQCIICQKTTGESLLCPANSKRKYAGAGYISFLRNVQEFKKLEINVTSRELPVDENQGIEQTLLHNKASWHKSCRDLYNNTKLERAKKRKLAEAAAEERIDETEEEIPSSPVKARRSSVERYNPQSQCFFCDEYDSPSNLNSASTLDVDENVRECAALLNERKLIAKLSVGDLIAIEAKYHVKCLVGLYNQARPFKQQPSKLPMIHQSSWMSLHLQSCLLILTNVLKSKSLQYLRFQTW